MRWLRLTAGDVRFQFRYGFYFLYALLSALYIALLSALPAEWRPRAALLLIFSDPAAMGLFFMGAIVLFEKSERVLDSLAVSPVRPWEYPAAKLVSIAVISTAAAATLGVYGKAIGNLPGFFTGTFLCSCLFSAVGLIVAVKIKTLNGFILATVPAELLINVPAVGYLFGWDHPLLLLHPGVCMLKLCMGAPDAAVALPILAAWTAAAAAAAIHAAQKSFQQAGGMKL